MIPAKWVVPLDEVPEGHALIVALRAIGLTISVFVDFHKISAALFGRKGHEDSSTKNEGATEVLTNTIALIESEFLR